MVAEARLEETGYGLMPGRGLVPPGLGAGVEEETDDAEVAYVRFPAPEPTRYRDGWLPDG